jgi:hypothetical protein
MLAAFIASRCPCDPGVPLRIAVGQAVLTSWYHGWRGTDDDGGGGAAQLVLKYILNSSPLQD